MNYEIVNQLSMPFSDQVAIQNEEANRTQAPYTIPAKAYLLRTTTHPIEEIGAHTNLFQQIPEPYREFLFRRLCDRAKLETVYSDLPAPNDAEILKRIIGENGHYLKLTTGNCNVDFIWHDREAKVFRFWAPKKYNLIQAMNIIRGRIIKYVGEFQPVYEIPEPFINLPPPPPPPTRAYRSASPEPISRAPIKTRQPMPIQRSMSMTCPVDLAATPEPADEPADQVVPTLRSMSIHQSMPCEPVIPEPADNDIVDQLVPTLRSMSIHQTMSYATPEPADQVVPIMRSMSMHHPQYEEDYDDDTDDEMPGLI